MRKTVLVVEDEFLIAMDLTLLLEQHGWCVLGPAATVEEALLLLDVQLPAVAVLDVTLRDGSVTRVAEALRAQNVPFVVVSLPDPYALTEVNSAVLGAVQKEGVVVFDASQSRDDYFQYDRHPKATWHADLARRLADFPFIQRPGFK